MDSARYTLRGDDAVALAVERGPDWLFVRLPESGGREAVRVVGELLETSMTRRVVLELDQIDRVDGELAEAISSLGRHVEQAGGAIRLCGLSESNLAAVRMAPGAARFPHYACRTDAVRASRDPALVAAPTSAGEPSHPRAGFRSDHAEPLPGPNALQGRTSPRGPDAHAVE